MNITHFYDKIQYTLQVPDAVQNLLRQYSVPNITRVEAVPLDIINENEYVNFKVLVASNELVNNGKTTFLKGKFSVGSDKLIDFKAWNNEGFAENLNEVLKQHKFLSIVGKVNVYMGSRSIIIESFEVITNVSEEEAVKYLPYTDENMNMLLAELLTYVHSLDVPYKTLCHTFLDTYLPLFSKAPAAKGHHHAYQGGLLKHTVGLMRVAYFIKHYSGGHLKALLYLQTIITNRAISDIWYDFREDSVAQMRKEWDMTWLGSLDHMMSLCRKLAVYMKDSQDINWDIVFTSILFHDSAKVFEYTYLGDDINKFMSLYPNSVPVSDVKGSIGMDSNKGQGHIPMSAMILMKVINESQVALTTVDIAKLNNTIFSHHGKYEWGSPSLAEYPEGIIVHFADMCDSRYEKDITV